MSCQSALKHFSFFCVLLVLPEVKCVQGRESCLVYINKKYRDVSQLSTSRNNHHHDIAEILLTIAVKHHKPNTNTKGSLRELSMWEIDRESIIKYWKMCSFILSDFSINMCNCCNFVIYLALININAVYLCEQHRRTISL